MTNYKHSDLTGRIIKYAIEVHNVLGNGFQEVIYQRALSYELEQEGLHFAEEYSIPIMYKTCSSEGQSGYPG